MGAAAVAALGAVADRAPALGLQAPANVLVGGQLASADEGFASPHDAFVTVGGDGGATVPVTVTTALRCGTRSRQVRLSATATRDATGAFLVSRPFGSGGGRLRATVTLFGRTIGDEATGSVTATGTLRLPGEGRVTCRRTTVDWRAHRATATPAATGAVVHGALLVGATTGRDANAPVSPILLRTSGDGTSLVRTKWRVAIPCDSSGDGDLPWAFSPIHLGATGRFVADRHAVDPAGDATWDISVRFGGHVGAGGAAGYLRVVERETLGGSTIDRCDTGRLHWTAVVTPPPAA